MKTMKAVGYFAPKPLSEGEALLDLEIPIPQPRPSDLLVQVRAVAINPVDYKVRRRRESYENQPVVLGWDASGVVASVGSEVTGFAPGDEVYYAGDLNRQGSNAEYQVVDHRLVGRKPKTLSFTDAASLPLTALTAYEALFEKLCVPKDSPFSLLVIGGAGGVGTMAIQLAKALTSGAVLATYGRDESRAWLESLQVDGLIDRRTALIDGIRQSGREAVDFVFSTTHTSEYIGQIADAIRPFGSLCLIDDPETLDILPLKARSVSVMWELMFTKSLFGYRMETQGRILNEVAALADDGKIKATAARTLRGLRAETFKSAHAIQESETAIAKTVIEF